jgi:HEPN pEK499 p136
MATIQVVLGPRNDRLGLAQRGWANLLLVERSFKETGEGHVVTQLVQTLLSILVFPKETHFSEHLRGLKLDPTGNWPLPKQMVGTTPNMGELLRHMRNAVCHGRVKFFGEEGPNSRFVDDISIMFEDKPMKPPGADIDWRVVMEGRDLKRFLFKLLEYLHDGLPGSFD